MADADPLGVLHRDALRAEVFRLDSMPERIVGAVIAAHAIKGVLGEDHTKAALLEDSQDLQRDPLLRRFLAHQVFKRSAASSRGKETPPLKPDPVPSIVP